jgi:Ca2+-transporting ATPase
MGIAGTDVARGASDLILLDDDFSTIVKAVRQGRGLYANLQRFLTFFLGTNAAQVVVILASVCVGLPLPLSPLNILVVNLIVDGGPTLALSMEPVEPGTMKLPPRDPNEHVLTSRAWVALGVHTGGLVVGMLVAYMLGLYWFAGRRVLASDISSLQSCERLVASQDGDWRTEWQTAPVHVCREEGLQRARTMAFVVLVFSEVLRGFTVRTNRFFLYPGFLSDNWVLDAAIALSALVACVMLFVPGVDALFTLRPLSWVEWILCIAFILAILVMDEVAKAIFNAVERSGRRHRLVEERLDELVLQMRVLRAHMDASHNDADTPRA